MKIIHPETPVRPVLENLKRGAGAFFEGRKKVFLWVGLAVALLMGVAFYSFYMGAILYRENILNGQLRASVLDTLKSNIKIPWNYAKAQTSQPERLILDIKFKHLRKIDYLIDQSYVNGFIPEAAKEEKFSIKISVAGESFKGKARLKGHWLDHVNSEKFSLRIRLEKGKSLFGMRQFSLLHPKTRNGIYEWVGHQLLQYEGLISKRMKFVDVTLNGKHHGIYVLEEHPEKYLIENNQRREGLVFKLARWSLDSKEADGLDDPVLLGTLSQEKLLFHMDSLVRPLGAGSIQKNPEKSQQLRHVQRLFAGFFAGEIKASQLFDTTQMARMYAISDLLFGSHSLLISNLRFYFNPITGLIEPIVGEWNTHPSSTWSMSGDSDLSPTQLWNWYEKGENCQPFQGCQIHQRLFQEAEFWSLYVGQLKRLTHSSYLPRFYGQIGPELEKNLSILHRDYPYSIFEKRFLTKNQTQIRRAISENRSNITAFYQFSKADQLTLFIQNKGEIPLHLHSVSVTDGKSPATPVSFSAWIDPLNGFHHPQFRSAGGVRRSFQTLTQSLPVQIQAMDRNALSVALWMGQPGQKARESVTALPWPHQGDLLRFDPIRLSANSTQFPFLIQDEQARTIRIKPGRWTLSQTLVLPPDYRILASSDTHLDLTQGAMILSYSPLQWIAEANRPIRLFSSDGTGQGLLVLNTSERSRLHQVHFSHLARPLFAGWSLTSSVNFYQADVDIQGCRFANNHDADDILNIIRSDFLIEQTLFSHSFSDAVDIDFGTGIIRHSRFVNCGGAVEGSVEGANGDCLDFSGSRIQLQEVQVNGAGDKAVSVGERSQVRIEGLTVSKANIGIASKDGSQVKAQGVRLATVAIGLSAYQKKSEFGPATIVVDRLSQTEVGQRDLIEVGSTLIIDGQRFSGQKNSVRQQITPVSGQ
ncbi:MAG: CotH kinase family protein [Magnetococcales bacterium]|nr:CotH kinase family protein [Magnetococcales bacterium]